MIDSGNLLLKIVGQDNNPLAGASNTDLFGFEAGAANTSASRVRNSLRTGFKPGYIIEIDSFSFQCGTSGLEPGTQPLIQYQTVELPTSQKDPDDDTPSARSMARRGGYQAWRNGTAVTYPLDVQPISFVRPIDLTSPVLIQGCIDSTTYKSLTIIKRKPIGDDRTGDVYLRIDFSSVLIVKVDWSDDDVVKETCRFIARGITVSYRPQLAHGGLGPIIPGFWSMNSDIKQETFT